jgi:hypothetical protein
MPAAYFARLENVDVLGCHSQHPTLGKAVPRQLGDVGFKQDRFIRTLELAYHLSSDDILPFTYHI